MGSRALDRRRIAGGIVTIILASAVFLVFPVARAETGTLAYVANYGDGTVTVIDTATNAVVGPPISVGRSPFDVAIAPDDTRAYVTNANAHTISVIDTATLSVVATIGLDPELGGFLRSIAITPDGRRAYVTDTSDNDGVWVVDTRTNTFTQLIRIHAPIAVAVSPNGRHAYVGAREPDRLLTIDAATSTMAGEPTLLGPDPDSSESLSGVAVSRDGAHAYVTRAGTISVIDTRTSGIVETISLGGLAIAITPDGKRAYVTNQDDGGFLTQGSVSVIDTLTNTADGNIPVGHDPLGVAITPDGRRAYVTSSNDGTVSVIDIASGTVSTTLTVGAQPLGIAISPRADTKQGGGNGSDGCSIRPRADMRGLVILLVCIPRLWWRNPRR